MQRLVSLASVAALACTEPSSHGPPPPSFGSEYPSLEWRVSGCVETLRPATCLVEDGASLVVWAAIAEPRTWYVRSAERWRPAELTDQGPSSGGHHFRLRLPAGATAIALDESSVSLVVQSVSWANVASLQQLARVEPEEALEQVATSTASGRLHELHLEFAKVLAARRMGQAELDDFRSLFLEARAAGAEQLSTDLASILAFGWARRLELDRVGALLTEWPPSLAGRADEAIAQARLAYAVGDFASALRWGELGADEASRIQDEGARLDATVMFAASLGQLGLPGEGAQKLRDLEAREACMRSALASSEAWLWTESGRLTSAEEAIGRSLEASQTCARGQTEAFHLNVVGLNLRRGDLSAAHSALARAQTAASSGSLDLLEAEAALAEERGDLVRARAHYRTLLRRAASLSRPDLEALAAMGLARNGPASKLKIHVEDALEALGRWSDRLPTNELRGAAFHFRGGRWSPLLRKLVAQGETKTALRMKLGLERLRHPRRPRQDPAPELRRVLATKRLKLADRMLEEWSRPRSHVDPVGERLRAEIRALEGRFVGADGEAPKEATTSLVITGLDGDDVAWRWKSSVGRASRDASDWVETLKAHRIPPRVPILLVDVSFELERAFRTSRVADQLLGARHPVVASLGGRGPASERFEVANGRFVIDDAGRSVALRRASPDVTSALESLGWTSLHPATWTELASALERARSFLFAGHAGTAGHRHAAALEFAIGDWPSSMLLALRRTPRFVALFACEAGSIRDASGAVLDAAITPALIRAGSDAVVAPVDEITAKEAALMLRAFVEALGAEAKPFEAWMKLHDTSPELAARLRMTVP